MRDIQLILMNGIDVLIHKYPMELNFKAFCEASDDKEEFANFVRMKNNSIEPPFKMPIQIDPDDLYHEGGIFTFIYSLKAYTPPGLLIASRLTTHREIVNRPNIKLHNNYGETPSSVSGRYGLYENTTPVVALWNHNISSLVKETLKTLWTERLIHPESYLCIAGSETQKTKPLVKEVIFGHIPDQYKTQASEEVEIMGKKYSLRELPMFLHVLPAASQEHKNISAFICSNMAKYPVLKGLAYKVKCPETQPLYAPKMTLQQRQLFNTSESHLDK